ncbi:MAG: amidohydrolase, partial [Frankiales bacterium]|nr:amidohydrolase [Frankiales bacterium]
VSQVLYGDNFSGSDVHEGDLTDGLGLSTADQEAIRFRNALGLMQFDDLDATHGVGDPSLAQEPGQGTDAVVKAG